RGEVWALADDRDQSPSVETRDGRVRAAGEHRRPGRQVGRARQHPLGAHRARSRRTDLEIGANRMKAGIVSYGGYIPRYRIRPKDIGVVWGADGEAMGRGLNIRAKSVPGPDEDVITISVEAARACMAKVDIDPTEIGAIYVGSESHPYAVKPTATIVAEAIGWAPVMTAADFEFACKAGTAAIQTSMGLTLSKMMKYSLAIGSDTSQGAPGDALEYSASAGGAALLIGVDHAVADISHTVSYTTDTPDFWRREGQRYPSHGGRFTGEPAYFKHVVNCAQLLFKRAGTTAEDYDYAVFHQPNGKFPVRVAKQLGFKDPQIDAGLCVRDIGNTYSGAIMVGLCAILDEAEAGDRIFAVGYGSGAGSDAFDLTVTDEITKIRRDATPTIKEMIADHAFVDYATYAKYRGKILMREASADAGRRGDRRRGDGVRRAVGPFLPGPRDRGRIEGDSRRKAPLGRHRRGLHRQHERGEVHRPGACVRARRGLLGLGGHAPPNGPRGRRGRLRRDRAPPGAPRDRLRDARHRRRRRRRGDDGSRR